ncbi:MAG: SLBB domain-containing protein [Acidobacteria bacterium]|nr:SLBB domain-containing protein [Acidobacteriota bacterium]
MNSLSLLSRVCTHFAALGFAVALSAPTILHAQCADSLEPDALGCPTPMMPSPLEVKGGVAVPGFSTAPSTPSADHSSMASAVGSVSGGESFRDAATRQREVSSGVRTQVEEETEFQKFVATSTGRLLRHFGADLFSQAIFAPVLNGPAPQEMIIGPDDELKIRIWGQINFSADLRVTRGGDIYLPKVGPVHVAGLPFSEVTEHTKSAIQPYYRNFGLTVDLGEIHTIQIYMTGLARRPGAYTVSGLSTLVDAVFASGGPSPQGSMRHVLLKRKGTVVTDYDLYALVVNGDKTGDVQLQPGDVLYIPAAGEQVALLGSVRQPAIYELRGAQSLTQIIDAAGGKSNIAAKSRISIERIVDHSTRQAIEVSLDEAGASSVLHDGDIVRIDPILPVFKQTVTLRGAVANPGKFNWRQGIRLSDLIPDRDSLVKRDYWWERARLGMPTPELSAPAAAEGNDEKPAAVSSPSAQTNWNYAVVERLNPATMATTLIPFSLGMLVLEHDNSQDMELQPGDVITIFTQSDIRIPVKEQTKYVRLEGEFVHPGIYSIGPEDNLRSVIAKAGGFTPQAYLYGSVFTRVSTRDQEQRELEEFASRLEHQYRRDMVQRAGMPYVGASAGQVAGQLAGNTETNAANQAVIAQVRNMRATGRVVLSLSQQSVEENIPDMQLEDGDRLEVPFRPATVQVIGAVYNPHAFICRVGAKAAQYLQIAGGVTREADRSRMYILRADGTVAAGATGMFSHGVEDIELHPGDALIVPEKQLRPSKMNTALAWTQALSQSTLTAIEVNALTH